MAVKQDPTEAFPTAPVRRVLKLLHDAGLAWWIRRRSITFLDVKAKGRKAENKCIEAGEEDVDKEMGERNKSAPIVTPRPPPRRRRPVPVFRRYVVWKQPCMVSLVVVGAIAACCTNIRYRRQRGLKLRTKKAAVVSALLTLVTASDEGDLAAALAVETRLCTLPAAAVAVLCTLLSAEHATATVSILTSVGLGAAVAVSAVLDKIRVSALLETAPICICGIVAIVHSTTSRPVLPRSSSFLPLPPPVLHVTENSAVSPCSEPWRPSGSRVASDCLSISSASSEAYGAYPPCLVVPESCLDIVTWCDGSSLELSKYHISECSQDFSRRSDSELGVFGSEMPTSECESVLHRDMTSEMFLEQRKDTVVRHSKGSLHIEILLPKMSVVASDLVISGNSLKIPKILDLNLPAAVNPTPASFSFNKETHVLYVELTTTTLVTGSMLLEDEDSSTASLSNNGSVADV